MAANYHNLGTGNFGQNWSNAGLITANDDWSGVSSIVGYLGDISSASTADVDPRTLTAATLGAVDVIANQTATTINNGGVAEFAIANPVVALQGSGTADAPSLVIYLDATGRQNIRFQANIRDIDATVTSGVEENAAQQVAIQYRTDPNGVWTNVPNGYFADVTALGATMVTAVDLVLPAAANGAATLQIRILTTNAGGNDEWVGIDDIAVSSDAAVTAGALSIDDQLNVVEGTGAAGATTPVTFTVARAGGSTGSVTVDWAVNTATVTSPTSAGDFVGATSGTLTFADGVLTQTITLNIATDTTPEALENYRVLLTNATGGATIADGEGLGSIANDDGNPISVVIGDASLVEGNSGQTFMTFTVTRSGGTGAFSVDYATANGSATASGDYTAANGTLSFADGENTRMIQVAIIGDTMGESNETFTVNLTNPTNGAILSDANATGTITDDDLTLTLIHEIQGTSYYSPIVAGAGITGFGSGASTTTNATSFTVTVRAVVTAIDSTGNKQGFYITEESADWDASNLTSEGIFVMTSTDTAGVGTGVLAAVPGIAVGTIVTVTANVMEYRPFNTNGPQTVLVNPVVSLGATSQPLPTLTLDGAFKIPNALLSGVAPVFTDSNDDAGDSFDATNYAMSFFETIEGMLVTVPDVRVADGFTAAQGGGTNFKVYSAVSANAEQLTTRGGYTIAGDPVLSPPDTPSTLDNVIAGGRGVTDGDINPDILELDFSDFAVAAPAYVSNGLLSMGDRLGNITGFVEWNFTDMKLIPTAVGTFVDTTLTKEVTTIAADPRALTFATFNVENLGGNADASRFTAIATVIANSLGSPAILSIEEIQDNNGATAGDGISSTGSDATTTWTKLVAAVNAATGRVYQWVDQAPVYNAEGGEPNGNIRVGFLYDTGRVQLGNLAANAPIEERRKFVDRLGDNVRDAGDLIAYSDNMVSGIATADYTTTRLSLLGQFSFNGNTIFALANHLPSKGGSGTFWDASQQDVQNGTPANSDWTQRSNIGEDIYTLLNYIQTQNTSARILSGGDYNDFYFYRPLETATGYVFANGNARNDGAKLVNLALALPEAERYTYTFDGRSQAIDHILADAATAAAATTDVVHINSGFPTTNRISDHDPVLTSVDLRSFGEVLNGTSAGETINGFGGDDVIDGKGGTDTLIGGAGNDIFFVDSLDDVVTENAGEGFDEIRTTVSNYVLPANVEKLTYIGTGGGTVAGNAGDNSVGGSTGADNLDLSQGGADTVSSGGGDDGIFFGAAFGAGDVVDGGAGGNDQLGLQGNYTGGTAIALSNANLKNVEVVGLLAGAGNSYVITAAADLVTAGNALTIYASTLASGQDLTFTAAANTAGSYRVYAGGGTDVITTGAGDDGVYFGPGRFNPALDRVDAGTGADDQLGLDGSYTITLDGTSIRNIETIVLLPGTVADRNSFNLTLDASLVGAGQSININGAQTVLAMSVNGASVSGNLTLVGGAGADTLVGGGGADILFGGAGGDTMTGGAGADIFRYASAGQSTSVTYDTITDFAYGTDTIDLPGTHDSYTRVTTGTLNSGASFDSDLQAVMTGQLTVGGAVVFTASGGTLSGATFVVVDANGVAGYQAGDDYVIRVDGTVPPVIPNFIV